MLPTLDLSGTPDLDHVLHYKRREAAWKRSVSESHKEWCLCGSYRNHFISSSQPLIESCGEGGTKEDGGDGGDDPIIEGGDIADEEMLAAGGQE